MEEVITEKKPENKEPAPAKPKSKKGCCVAVAVIVLFIIIAAVGLVVFGGKKVKEKLELTIEEPAQTEEIDWNGEYSGPLDVKTASIDETRSVSKTFGPEGSTMSTEAADGTLYTLTVPGDALILPIKISMSPLKEASVKGFDNPEAGFGVYLDGGFSFIRPAFLTIQPKTKMPELGPTKAVAWDRCNISSRGYDPEICAGKKGIRFGGGVEPGKVVVHARNKNDDARILLAPTIPVQANAYNAQVFQPGAYFGAKIDKKMAKEISIKTFFDAYEYANASESLMHLLTLGGDIQPFKEQIDRFPRVEKSYPRETVKGAILLLALGNKEGYEDRIGDFKTSIDSNFKNLRASFMPWSRYIALLLQLEKNKSNASIFSTKVNADDDLGDWPDDLPDYDEDAQNDTSGSSWGKSFLAGLNQLYRDILATKYYSCSDRLMASEALELLGTLDAADRAAMNSILSKCSNQCKTLEECEQQGDAARRRGDNDGVAAANYRINAYLEQNMDCTSETKKNLENYGQNFCS